MQAGVEGLGAHARWTGTADLEGTDGRVLAERIIDLARVRRVLPRRICHQD